MFKSKQDVDRHVRNILGRIKDEKEKTSRGYQIARLYYEIEDFESAKRYLTKFLSMRENVPQAHKLLGQIYDSLNQNELAIQSFNRSLELDSNQQDLVNKVGSMYSNPRQEKTERLVDKNIDDHMKTIKQLVVSKRPLEAFHLIKEIEGDQLYKNSLEWYEYLVENFTVIKNSIDEDEMIIYIYHLLSVLRLSYLQLSSKYLEKCNKTILLMDELLWKAEKICNKKKEWKYLRDEIQGQLFYLAGTLLLKKAEKKLLPYKEVVPISMMCYLISCSYQCLQEYMDWYNLISKENKLFTDLFSYSNYRLCQAGHMLHIMDKSPSLKPVQHYMQQLCATPWNKTLHEQLFPWIRNGESKGSFILMSSAIYNRSLTVPKLDEVLKYDREACHLVQHKLSEIVWILIQRYSPEDINYNIELNFPKLQYGETDLNSNAIESLSQLDIEAFLYATVRCSAMKIADDKSGRHPFLLPAAANTSYCSPEQTEWWKFAFCFYSNNKLTDFGKMRRTLQHGLEVIRLMGNNHGLSVETLLYLAKCFEAKMNRDVEYTASQLTLIKDRAYHYWYNVLTLIEQIESNGGHVPSVSSNHLFPEIDSHKILDPNTMLTLKEEIKLAIGKRLQEDGVYDMALDYYRSLTSPWASFYSSEVYRLMGEREAELSDQRKIYLEKSLSCLHSTLDRLQGDKHHELNQLVYPYIKEIEKLIRQSENEWEEDASNNSRYHTPQGKVDVDNYQQNTSTPSSKSFSSARCLNLTPQTEKKHLQPSPERLDSQIRQLSHYQESILKVVLRRNEELAKSNVDLASSLKECMETIKELKFEMYHRSAVFGGGMNASRSYIGVQSPYKADMLPQEMSPASVSFMDSPKPPAHLLQPQMQRNDPRSQMYQYSNMMDPSSCQMNMSNRRMQQQYGSMQDMESNYAGNPGNQYFPPVSHDNSTFSQLPGPGYFSPIKGASRVPQPEPVQAPVVPPQSQRLTDTSSPFQVLFCGKISYGNQTNVILKIISIGNLTQVILEPTHGVGEIESYDVRTLTKQTSLSPLMVICKHKSAAFEKILHLTFETMDRSNVFTQILSQFLPPGQTAEYPSAVQASPKNSSLPSFTGFSTPVEKPPAVQQTPNSSQVPESPKATEQNTSVEEYEPNVTFEPVIALPELVPVRTGEEGEAIAYSDRGKLFRYDLAAKSWKERGVGEFKILKNDANTYRFLMRRDQVLKICANHVLTTDMNLTTLSNSDKAWCWSADDFADEEVKHEKFALKFKTPEAAQNFKAEFEKCQSLIPETKSGDSKPTPELPANGSSGSTQSTSSSTRLCCKAAFVGSATFDPKLSAFGSSGTSLSGGTSAFGSSLIKPSTFGSVAQDPKQKESPFLGFSLTPKTTPKKDNCEPAKTSSPFAGFSFNNKEPSSGAVKTSPLKPPVLTNQPKPSETKQPSLSQLFKPDPGSWECSGCLILNKGTVKKCLACNTLKPGENLEPAGMPTESGSSTKMSFGACGGFSFASTEKNKTDSPKSCGFVFGSSSVFTAPQSTASGISVFGTPKPSGNAAKSQPSTVKSLLEAEGCEASAEFSNGKNPDKTVPLSELFKNQNDTWQCSSCLCNVKTSLKQCPACMTMKPGETADPVQTSATESVEFSFASGGGFSFASKPETGAPKETGGGFTFGSQSVAEPKETGFSFGSKPATEVTSTVPGKAVSGAFSFGAKAPDSSTPKSTGLSFGSKPAADSTTGFSFGAQSAQSGTNKPGVFSFSPAPSTTPMTAVPTQADGSKGFTFTPQSTPKATSQGTLNPFTAGSTPGFTFSMTPSKPTVGQASTIKSPENKANTSTNDDYYVNSEEDDSHIVFEPVIPLPDKVEVKTMEEDEDVLFNYRSKLFRFVNGEWKEKGLGNIKILEHQETKTRRIVMRRDQVHKVCCNHLLTSDMVIKDMPKSEGKALVWFAHDFSDEEEKVEQLSAKFKTAEIASQFQELFEESVKKAKEDGNNDASQDTSTLEKSLDDIDGDVIYEETEYATPEEIQQARKYQLPDHFYLYSRKPPCPGCRGCEDAAPVQTQDLLPDPIKKVSKIPVSSKTFEPKSSPQPQATDKPTASLFGFGSATSAPGFGSLTSNQASVSPFSKDLANTDLSTVTFQGGDTTFSSLAASAGENAFCQTKGNKPFKWSGAGSKLFGVSGGNDSTDQADDSTDEVNNEDVHFEPVIPLPDLVEVVTGEEDWESIFTQRSKLFRFDKDTNQWKERGTGEIKLMKFLDKEEYRVLFRREQVLKVVCNHMIGPHIEMKPMNTSEKSWCWVAEDFSDEEGKIEKFAVRFKTMEVAQKFKEAFDSVILALQMKDQSIEDKNDNSVTEEDIDDDVLFDKRATLFTLDGEQWTRFGLGNLKVVKEEDVGGSSIEFVDDQGQVGCRHIICKEYTVELERSRKYCIWSAVDFSRKKQEAMKFKAVFSSPSSAEEFFNKFRYSLELASDSKLTQLDDDDEEDYD